MQESDGDSRRVKWEIVDINDEDYSMSLTNTPGEENMDMIFQMLLEFEGDVSDWEDRALFGQIVDAHSDLAPSEIAVFLCYDSPIDMYPESPTYERRSGEFTIGFTGPRGRSLELRKKFV